MWWVFALWGGFRWNVGFSVAGRLIYYVAVCASLPLFRRTRPGEAALVIPGGKLLAILGVGISLVLITRIDRMALLILSVVLAVTLANWLWARRKSKPFPPTLVPNHFKPEYHLTGPGSDPANLEPL